MIRRLAIVAILLTTLASAIILVRWADGEFHRVEPPGVSPRRDRPYRRIQHALIWVGAAASVGMGAIVALDGRKRPCGPGTLAAVVSALIVVATAADFLLAAPAIDRQNGTCYGLRNVLEYRVPGAIIGAWAVAWLWPRRAQPDWREWGGRIVFSLWMANVSMLIAHGVLFG